MARKEILEKQAEKALQKIIKARTGKENVDVFDNLDALCEKVEKWGQEKQFIPLKYKKMLATALDCDHRIEYRVNKTDSWCEVEALFYWSDCETPTGTGFVRMHITQIAPYDSMTTEERLSLLETTCRGAAATRAISDAGIGAGYYGDIEENSYMEANEVKALESALDSEMEQKVPNIKSKEEKKREKREKPSVKDSEPETIPVEEPDEQPVQNFQVFSEALKTISEIPEEIEPEPQTEAIIDLEEAFSAIADIGICAGNTLKVIYEANPKQLIWLANRSPSVSDYAKAIIMSDDELRAKYERRA